MLKGRWQSLRELRILIKEERSAGRVNLWIQACIVLHNYLVDLRDSSNVVMVPHDVGGPVQGAQEDIGEE